MYASSFAPLDAADLEEAADCQAPNIRKSNRGRPAKKRIHGRRKYIRKNQCSVCHKPGHTKRSPICKGGSNDIFVLVSNGQGIKIREHVPVTVDADFQSDSDDQDGDYEVEDDGAMADVLPDYREQEGEDMADEPRWARRYAAWMQDQMQVNGGRMPRPLTGPFGIAAAGFLPQRHGGEQ